MVDQFEELFTTLSPIGRDEYANWLADAAASDGVTVVVAVRSDYYAQAAAYPRLADLLAANTVLVGEMSPDELRQAVELPAAAAGLESEAGLAKAIADDVAGEPGGLPLMSTRTALAMGAARQESADPRGIPRHGWCAHCGGSPRRNRIRTANPAAADRRPAHPAPAGRDWRNRRTGSTASADRRGGT